MTVQLGYTYIHLFFSVRALHQTRHTAIQEFFETTESPFFQLRKHSHPKIQEIYIQSTVLLLTLAPCDVTTAWLFKLPSVTGPGCRTLTFGSSSSIIRKISAENRLNAVPWVKEKHVPRLSPLSSLVAFNTPTTSLGQPGCKRIWLWNLASKRVLISVI